MADSLTIEFDRPDRTYEAGDIVRGRLVIETDRGERCEDVRLARYWKTHGRGNSDTGGRLEATIHRGPLEGAGPHEISFEVATPARPFTYHGHDLKVDHYLEARVDIPWAIDPKVTEDFLLVPGESVGGPPARLVYAKPGTGTGRAARRLIGGVAIVAGVLTLPLGLFFILFGLLFLAADVKRKLAATKVGDVKTRLEPRVVEPGGETRLSVKLRPRKSGTLNEASAELRATEVCVSGSGTDRKTHRHQLHSERVALTGPVPIEAGRERTLEAVIPIPELPAYTFRADRNSVVWEVVLHLDIPSWPDWEETLALTVWPGGWRERPALAEGASDAGGAAAEARGPAGGVHAAGVTDGAGTTVTPPETTTVIDEPPREVEEPVVTDMDEADLPAPDDLPPLAAAVARIHASSRFGGERAALVGALIGSAFDFRMTVLRVERTFGAREPGYRRGRSVTGTVAGTRTEIEVRFPETVNAELDEVDGGSERRVTATVASWDRLSERPVLQAEDPGAAPSA